MSNRDNNLWLICVVLSFGVSSSAVGQDKIPEGAAKMALTLEKPATHPDCSMLKRPDIGISPGSKFQFSPDGKYLAAVSHERIPNRRAERQPSSRMTGLVLLWNLREKKLETSLRHDHVIYRVCFSPAGDLIFGGCENSVIKMWRVPDGRLIDIWESSDGPVDEMHHLAMSPNGKLFVSCGRIPVLWDYENKQSKPLNAEIKPVEDSVGLAIFAPDHDRFITTWQFERMTIWSAKTQNIIGFIKTPKMTIRDANFSPDGKIIATADNGAKPGGSGWIRLWDAEKHTEIAAVRAFQGTANATVFSPDGKYLIARGADRLDEPSYVRIWEMASGKQVNAFWAKGRDFAGLAISADGKTLAVRGVQSEQAPETDRYSARGEEDICLYDFLQLVRK